MGKIAISAAGLAQAYPAILPTRLNGEIGPREQNPGDAYYQAISRRWRFCPRYAPFVTPPAI
jgi:hypothetical protein